MNNWTAKFHGQWFPIADRTAAEILAGIILLRDGDELSFKDWQGEIKWDGETVQSMGRQLTGETVEK